ncbi:MAG: penicillin-binding transpeptidase domain-containing protein, partial [Pseudomonadota bacterium]|nr:penicillin-binding transpeptidase domain-containing protein [Pseudomonadota bacterium]
ASAFSVFANGGEMVEPTIIHDGKRRRTRRVFSAPTAALVTSMFRDAVVSGTGSRAEVAGYRVAGKTGTAEKPVPGGYSDTANMASFAAVFPADSPDYVVLIVLDDPKDGVGRGRAAAWNAAPTAGRVIERVAPMLGVEPKFERLNRDNNPMVRSVSERRSSL